MDRAPRGYALSSVVERGHRSTVYRARREADGARVVIKVLSAEAPTRHDLARYRYAFHLLQELELPGVCRALELTSVSGRPALVVEDIGGEALRGLWRTNPLPLPDTLHIAAEVAEALGRLHALGIVHKDINPNNIVVAPDGRVQLIDFDLASKLPREVVAALPVTRLEGTLAYISPEQTGRTRCPVDHRTDLYSLGATLYEMVAGRLPFEDADPVSLVHKHLAVAPEPLTSVAPGIPPLLSALVARLLAKEPDERYQTAHAVAADLRRCQHQVAAGDVLDFELGASDTSPRLLLGRRLHGRESEASALLEAFERAASGSAELVLVAGFSGVGKTSLVRQLQTPVTGRRGHFCAGKFAALSNVPYAAIGEALTSLIGDLLADDTAPSLAPAVQAAVGGSGSVITDIVPAVARLIGPQPPVPELGPSESQNRFFVVFARFLACLATAERPLVLFLDDLQWADPASVRLLSRVLLGAQSRHLLVVAAYRDNEVAPGHTLLRTAHELEEGGTPLTRLTLSPLDRPTVTQLVADALRRPVLEVDDLAGEIMARTAGNPFFVERILEALFQDGAIRFAPAAGAFEWDPEAVARLGITDAAADLMVRALRRLPDECAQALQVAAAIGDRFELGLLAHALDRPPAEVAAALWPSLQDELVVGVGTDYRFAADAWEDVSYRYAHDRIREAAYATLPDDQRPGLHARLGRLLAADGVEDYRVTDQLNQGRAALDPEEWTALARRNLRSAETAMDAAAWHAALEYLDAGAELIRDDPASDYRLAFSLGRHIAEARLMVGDDLGAVQRMEQLLEEPLETADRVEVLRLWTRQLARSGDHGGCLDKGVEALGLLGFPVPADESEWAALAESEATALGALLASRPVPSLMDLPEMTDPTTLLEVELLATIAPVTFAVPHSLPVINPRAVRLSILHGRHLRTPTVFGTFGLMKTFSREYEAADEWLRAAMGLAERIDHPAAWPSVLMMYSTWVCHWSAPFDVAIEHARRGIDVGLRAGQFDWTGWITMNIPALVLGRGLPLERARAEMCEARDVSASNLSFDDAVSIIDGSMSAVLRLMGDDAALEAHEAAGRGLEPSLERLAHYPMMHPGMLSHNALAALVLRDFESASWLLERSHEARFYAPGLPHVVEIAFYETLTLLALGRSLDDEPLATHIRDLGVWAEGAPTNHGWKDALLEACVAAREGRDADAGIAFDQAIEQARETTALHGEALACEWAGRFYRERGRDTIARAYLLDARYAYVRWGADAKVRQLEAELPELRARSAGGRTLSTSGSRSGQGSFLDMEAVLRSTRAISEVIVLGELIERLLTVALEAAGAQAGCLLMPRGDDWVVRSRRGPDALVWPIVRYVVRSGERVVVSNAAESDRFASDPRVASGGVRSVLCLPIVRHQDLEAVLYLENNLVGGAFTDDRCALLDTIAAQAAISLRNATLLEERERTARAVARFLPTEFLELLGKKSVVDITAGDAAEYQMSVLFSDIRGFTTLTERMSPHELVDFLNRYFGAMVPLVRSNRGFVDKYIGDALMALYPGGVADGMASAVAMARRVTELPPAKGTPLRVGMGLHDGRMILGTIGDPDRLDGTVHSDAVNVAARLQDMTKQLGATILTSAAVRSQLPDPDAYPSRFLGGYTLRGKTEPIGLYEVFACEDDASVERKLRSAARFGQAVAARERGDHREAAARLKELVAENPSDLPVGVLLRESLSRLMEGER